MKFKLIAVVFFTICTFILNSKARAQNNAIQNTLIEDVNGFTYSTDEIFKKNVLVFFQGSGCPISEKQKEKIQEIIKKYKNNFTTIVVELVNPNKEIFKNEFGQINFYDKYNIITNLLKPRTMTESFIIVNRQIVYRGAIDDQLTLVGKKNIASQNYLDNAINEVLENKPVFNKSSDPIGCFLNYSDSDKKMSLKDFNKNVLPVLINRCINCHNEYSILNLKENENIFKFKKMIGFVVENNIMPPWHAEGDHWKNNLKLTDKEKKHLVRWVNSSDKNIRPFIKYPLASKFKTKEKNYSKDYELIEYKVDQFDIDAHKFSGYKYFKIPLHNQEEMWVDFIEVQSDVPNSLHHLISLANIQDYEDPQIGFYKPDLHKQFVSTSHSRDKNIRYNNNTINTGTFLPKNSIVYSQAHYEPIGRPLKENLKLIVYKLKKRPKFTRTTHIVEVESGRIVIPAYSQKTEFIAIKAVPFDGSIEAIHAHMHHRGNRFVMTLQRKGAGKKIELLRINKFAQKYQLTYVLKKKIPVKAGDIIDILATFDNSENNLDNPDPSQTVKGGPLASQEMAWGVFTLNTETKKFKKFFKSQ